MHQKSAILGNVGSMQVHLINLDRSPERLAEFTTLNRHLADVVRFPAVDGRLVDRAPLVQRGIIETGLAYTDGALGNSLSHFALWDRAIEGGEPLTVIEDDGITNRRFENDAEELLAEIAARLAHRVLGLEFRHDRAL